MSLPDIIVIGGGISGMSFAHYCAKAGRRVLVLEKNAALGGCLDSHRIEGGYWLELGAHTCYSSYQALLGILEERGAIDELRPRAKVPFRLYVDGEIRPIARELRIPQLLFSAPRILWSKKDGRSMRGFWEPIVGAANYRRVFGPLFTGVFSQNADDFPAEMMFKRRPRRKDVLRSYTLSGGLRSAVEIMARNPNITFAPDAEVQRLRRTESGFAAELADGSAREARRVAVAVPPSSAAALLAEVAPQAAQAAGQVKDSLIENVGVALRRTSTPIQPVGGIFPVDGSFHSAVSRDPLPDPTWRGFTFHFRSGLSFEEALQQIARILRTDREKLEHVARSQSRLPSPVPGHADLVRAIDQGLAGTSVFATGNYFYGLSIEDCVLRSRDEASRLVGQG